MAVRPTRLAARTVSRTEVSATVNRDRALTAHITAGAKVAVDVAVWRLQTKPEPVAIDVAATTHVAATLGRDRNLVADLLAATHVTAELTLTPPIVRDLDAEFADLLRETLILCEA